MHLAGNCFSWKWLWAIATFHLESLVVLCTFLRSQGECNLRRLLSSPLRPVQGAERFAQLEGKRRGDIGVGDHFNVGALICFRGAFERII